MSIYYYLSLIPEALIASMLPPKEFGSYLAVGSKNRTRGHAMFFTVERPHGLPFDLAYAEKRCVPHPNGDPKNSVYLGIYRIFEQIPISSLGDLYLVTPDGKVLELRPDAKGSPHSERYHLYQEICPVHPRVVSSLPPADFARHIVEQDSHIRVPQIAFVDLRLGELSMDPEKGTTHDLPYHAIEHLRDCLMELKAGKHTKIVDRTQAQVFPYRTVDTGFYVGSASDLRFYPFPSEEELRSRYYDWWRSASIMGDTVGLVP
jgi:hypothetical protein